MNWQYILKRMFLLLPTVFVVLLLTFLLTEIVGNNTVETMLDVGESSEIKHPRKLHSEYNQTVKKMGLDLPVFYYSITPRQYQNLQDVVDIRERKARKLWLKVADQDAVVHYYNDIRFALDTAKSLKSYSYYQSILFNGPNEFETFLEQSNHTNVSKWRSSAKKVLASSPGFTSFFPSFQWYGFNNRFHLYITKTLKFNWGNSKVDGRKVTTKIGESLTWTIPISLIVLMLSIFISWILSYFNILWKKKIHGRFLTAGIFMLYAMPLFWLATIAIVFFTNDYYGDILNIFPSVGIYDVDSSSNMMYEAFQLGKFLLLPIICMVMSGLAFFYLQWKDNAEDISHQPYIVTAKAKGLKRSRVIKKHIMSNASYSILGLTGFFIPSLISGSVIIEVLFNIPGMGRLMFNSIMLSDWNVVLGVVILSALVSFLGFLLSDFILKYLNPTTKVDA